MNVKIPVTCPYCGTHWFMNYELQYMYNTPETVLCPVEEGGCDRWFGIRPIVTITPEIMLYDNKRVP